MDPIFFGLCMVVMAGCLLAAAYHLGYIAGVRESAQMIGAKEKGDGRAAE